MREQGGSETVFPPTQFLPADLVLTELSHHGGRSVMKRSIPELVVLAMLAGGYITAGALFSVIISANTDNAGIAKLLEGFGFSVGFFMVMLTGTLLFTEANVEMPATLLGRMPGVPAWRILRMWTIAAFGNLAGAFVVGIIIAQAHSYSPEVNEHLQGIIAGKLSYRDIGGVEGWSRAVLSGVLGNWMVGMAAFLSTMGRSIIGKYIPVLLVVMVFIVSGYLHSPANMAFFGIAEAQGLGQGWGTSLAWGVAPAAVGNVLGGLFLVAFPFWFLTRDRRAALEAKGAA